MMTGDDKGARGSDFVRNFEYIVCERMFDEVII